MRLELRQISEGSAQAPGQPKWFFERGRRTLGRSTDCDWRVPEDQRAVSKLHCTIERDHDGFLLRDRSANGSRVDGITIHEGETARLADQSRLELGGLAFSVHIAGETERDLEDPDAGLAMSDEPLTISAILADIAPGGRTAKGVLGERVGDDWLEPLAARKNRPSPSRNVDIGWNGPPEIRSATKLLPDDWYTDGESQLGSHLEHTSATHVAVPVARIRPVEALETVNDNVPPADVEEDFPQLAIGRSGDLTRALEPLVSRLEEALENAFAVFETEPPRPPAEPDLFGASREEMLTVRVEALLAGQMKLNAALESLVQEASRMMEPRALEARIDAGARRFASLPFSGLPFTGDGKYWHAYRAQFERDGKPLSVRDVFRDAVTRAADTRPALIKNQAPAEQEGRSADEE